MNETITAIDVDESAFPSSAALREAHGVLLARHRELGDARSLLDHLDAFIRRGTMTGALLDGEDDRQMAQTFLDYWATAAYRVGHESPDATLADFDPNLAPELADDLCPYMGLEAFRADYHRLFFGRRRLIDEMVQRLSKSRLLTVVGPSGSGKSSLVLAGLVPELKAGALPDSQDWRYVPTLVPGSDPLASLVRAIRADGMATPGWAQSQIDLLRQDTGHLLRLIGQGGGQPAVLAIDQFEEVFTLCDDERDRIAFVDNLLALVNAPGARHTVVLTMRGEYASYVARIEALQAAFEHAEMNVTPLNTSELRDAIEKPANLVGLKFEEGIIDTLIKEIVGEPAGLPLLQFTLRKLWDRRERNRVTWAAYRRLGGARLALSNIADELYDSLIPEDQVTAKRILLRLVRPSQGLEVTSSRILRDTLYQAGEPKERIDRVFTKLHQAGLLRLTKGETLANDQIEVAHEALVRNWPTLVKWLENERAAIATRRRLEAKAAEWKRLGEGKAGLLDEVQLHEAEEWLKSSEAAYLGFDPALPALVTASSTALNEAARQRERSQRRRHLVLAAGLGIMAVLFVTAAIGWTHAARETRRAKALTDKIKSHAEEDRIEAEAQSNRQLALVSKARAAEDNAKTQAGIAKNKEAEAKREAGIASKNEAEANRQAGIASKNEAEAKRQAVIASKNEAEAKRQAGIAQSEKVNADLQRKIAQAGKLAFRSVLEREHHPYLRQASVLLAVEAMQLSHTWEADQALRDGLALLPRPVTRRPFAEKERVESAAFSPDGSRLITIIGNMVQIRDATTGQNVKPPVPFTRNGAKEITFTPDRKCLIATDGQKIYRWNAESGQSVDPPLEPPLDRTDKILRFAVSPEGKYIVATSGIAPNEIAPNESKGSLRVTLWDAVAGRKIKDEKYQGDFKTTRSDFSPDGQYLAVVVGGNAWIWETRTGRIEKVSRPAVSMIAFNPHDNHIVVVYNRYFWGVEESPFVHSLSAPIKPPTVQPRKRSYLHNAGEISQAVFEPNGKYLVLATRNTIDVFDSSSDRHIGASMKHDGVVSTLTFSPDGKYLETESAVNSVDNKNGGAARAWEVRSGREVGRVVTDNPENIVVAFSPNGKYVFASTENGRARIWELAGYSGTISQEPNYHAPSLGYSPDGKCRVVTGYSSLSVVETRSGRVIMRLEHLGKDGVAFAFSPDGKYLATNFEDNTARLWEVPTGRSVGKPMMHNDEVSDVAFGPKGKYLATGTTRGTPLLWEVPNGRPVGKAMRSLKSAAQKDGVRAVAVSPDGKYLAAVGMDYKARVWDVRSGLELSGLPHDASVHKVDFDPSGKYLVTATGDNTARVWEVANGREVARMTFPSEFGVEGFVAFSPDGKYVEMLGQSNIFAWLWRRDDLIAEARRRLTRNLTAKEWATYIPTEPYRKTFPDLP